jgi:preprotein translocase subunit SecG
MERILLVIHVFVTLIMIGAILIQRSEGGGLGLGGGSANGMFTARGASNFLTRATAILATIFMANAVLMTVIASKKIKTEQSIVAN